MRRSVVQMSNHDRDCVGVMNSTIEVEHQIFHLPALVICIKNILFYYFFKHFYLELTTQKTKKVYVPIAHEHEARVSCVHVSDYT